jgi:uncharacterized membrane protein YgcG
MRLPTGLRDFILFISLALCACISMQIKFASAAQAEEIKLFESNLRLSSDGVLSVTEDIVVDFAGSYRHGIFRIIPIKYHRGLGTYSIDLKVKELTDENGRSLPYRLAQNGPDLNLRIGDPNTTFTGQHVYCIKYVAQRVLNFFNEAPELYWNVTGNAWPFTIDKCIAHVNLPEKVSLDQVRSVAYTGALGSRDLAKVSTINHSLVATATDLMPGQGMTIVVGLPKGFIMPPTLADEFFNFVHDWLGLFAFPSLTAGLLYYFWNRFGRDEGHVSVISVDWTPPPNLTPAEVGTLIDEHCDTPDVTSTLIDLASRGYLKIKPIPYNRLLFMSKKDYQFTKMESPPTGDTLKPHEQLFINAMFASGETTTYLSSLKGTFALAIPEIKQAIWDSLKRGKLFFRDPEGDRQLTYVVAAGLFLIGLFVTASNGNDNVASGLGLILSGIITACAANAMPARTKAGSAALAQCKAFQRFVQKAEKNRIAVLAKEDPTIFGRLLPYAMVLGAADQWADAFKDLIVQPPDWYDNSAFGGNSVFLPNVFVQDLGSSFNNINAGLMSSPPPVVSSDSGAGGGFSGFSDGGGFSGGGFGGGGGGSW